MDPREFGGLLVVLGLVAVAVGLLAMSGGLGWLGRLPGDLRFGGDQVRVYVPLASMVVVSILLTIILNLLRRFF